MSVGYDITSYVRPPRTAFVNYPMGQTVGRPGHVEEQRAIVRAAFAAIATMQQPGTIVDLPFELIEDAPTGGRWQDWVYTRAYRDHLMKTRGGERYEGEA